MGQDEEGSGARGAEVDGLADRVAVDRLVADGVEAGAEALVEGARAPIALKDEDREGEAAVECGEEGAAVALSLRVGEELDRVEFLGRAEGGEGGVTLRAHGAKADPRCPGGSGER